MMAKQGTQSARPAPVWFEGCNLDPERGGINPGYFSSKWMITQASPRRTLRENRRACGVLHIRKQQFGILPCRVCCLERGPHETTSGQPECRRPAHLPPADRRLIPVLFGRHHRRGWPYFHEQARKRSQSIERNPDGALEGLISIYRRSGSSQACCEAVSSLGAGNSNIIQFFWK
jgi:hypothetical protein